MTLSGKILIVFLLIAGGWALNFTNAPCVAIWPSAVTLGLVLISHRILPSLLIGAWVGATLIEEGNPFMGLYSLIDHHLLPSFSSNWKVGALVFTLLIGGFVGLIESSGLLQKVMQSWVMKRSKKRVEMAAAGFGLLCFFDGLANSLLVGKLFRKSADQVGVSRAKLSYIVDTTSACVACLAFISTWIAYQLAMIRSGFELAGLEKSVQPYTIFFNSIPYNFYAWFALLFMGLSLYLNKDFGAMKNYPASQFSPGEALHRIEIKGNPWRVFIPIIFLVGFILVGLYANGVGQLGTSLLPIKISKISLAYGEANAPSVLIMASILASILAYALYPRSSENNPATEFFEGVVSLFQPALILVAAWMLSSTLNDLGAVNYLGSLLIGKFPLSLYPCTVFLIGAIVSFTTGTSWGTMGLLMPLCIPIVFQIAPQSEALVFVPVVVGAVFSGAVFGDHCSPISDTTIISSIACGIDPVDHVRTQLPYALTAGLGAALLGFIPAGLKTMGLGSLLLSAVFFLFLSHLLLRYQNK